MPSKEFLTTPEKKDIFLTLRLDKATCIIEKNKNIQHIRYNLSVDKFLIYTDDQDN